MAKAKKNRRKSKTTSWNIGQPLVFPYKARTRITRLPREAVEEAKRGPLILKRQKRKKK